MSILPNHYQEFQSYEYWNNFFIKRDKQTFEWYTSYKSIKLLIDKYINSKSYNNLIIGCGNSEFSADYYDDGYNNIVNIDFSELVIQEMINKHSEKRPLMKWDIGDMTNMNYDNETYDVVLDKGALDALMSINSFETIDKANQMFHEIDRILKKNGMYICISLAENYILNTLLQHYLINHNNYKIIIEGINDNEIQSPYKSFFIIISKQNDIFNDISISLFTDTFGNSTNEPLILNTIANCLETINNIQTFNQRKFNLSTIKSNRYEYYDFYIENSSVTTTIPKYRIFVIDNTEAIDYIGSCAALFIPIGRETEYQFSTYQGLYNLCQISKYKRLLAIRLNKPYSFSSYDILQKELDSIILSLAPSSLINEHSEKIPYMILGNSNDNIWECIDRGVSTQSGEYVVEEAPVEGNDNAVFRRLIFLQNQNLIQTEVKMILSTNQTISKKKNNSKSKSKSKTNTMNTSSNIDMELDFDYTFIDEHHISALLSFVLYNDLISSCCNKNSNVNNNIYSGLIIGLGGGAFPMCLQRYLPKLQLLICEIDAQLESIAKKHFGFKLNKNNRVVIDDGINVINQIYSSLSTNETRVHNIVKPLAYIFIDADSKDLSLGITAPPAAFITLDILNKLHEMLLPNGLLVLNVVARDNRLFDVLLNDIRNIFKSLNRGRVFSIKPSEEIVNRTIIAVKGITEDITIIKSTSNKTLKKITTNLTNKKEIYEWESNLESWLKATSQVSDPLKLLELLSQLKEY